MDKIFDLIGTLIAVILFTAAIAVTVGLIAMFAGFVWLGVQSVWGMII